MKSYVSTLFVGAQVEYEWLDNYSIKSWINPVIHLFVIYLS